MSFGDLEISAAGTKQIASRVREKDPVLGIVTVKLSELFKNSSEVTRLFSLQEGIGKCLSASVLFAV